MRIFLIRHGESLQNAGINNDLKDWEIPLTSKGQEQANKLGKKLAHYCTINSINHSNSVIISSPYIRTMQTANYINQYLHVPIIKSYSVIEYQHPNESPLPNNAYPEFSHSPFGANSLILKIMKNATFESANESNVEIVLRAKQFIQYLQTLQYDNLFIVSHKGFIKAFITAFNNLPYDDYYKHYNIKNCSLQYFEINGLTPKNSGELIL